MHACANQTHEVSCPQQHTWPTQTPISVLLALWVRNSFLLSNSTLGHVVLFEEQRQLAKEEVSELRDRLENVVCFITGEPMWDPVIG